MVSGDADIYISRLHPYPDDKMYDKSVIVDNNNNQMYSQTKFLSFEDTPAKLKGRYYVAIKARQFVFGSITLSQDEVDLSKKKIDQFKEIKFGETVYGSLKAAEGVNDTYFFDLNIPDNQSEAQIVL